MTPESYETNGFARMAGSIDLDQVAAARRWIDDHRQRDDIPHTRDALHRSNPLPIKLRRLWEADRPFWSGFIARSGALDVARRWLGDDFLLIRSAAFIKYPGSQATVGWHCDEHLWGQYCDAGLTVWIPASPVPVESGCLQFLAASHRRPPGPLCWDLRHPYHKVMDITGLGLPTAVPVALGDCIVMDKSAVHASGPNRSTAERVGLVLAFARCEPEALVEPAVVIASDGSYRPVAVVAP